MMSCPGTSSSRWKEPRVSRGSVLIIVLVTMMFATFALTLFIEKAFNDLLVEAREADAMRLRAEAYSALETTLAVLEDYRQGVGPLLSPQESWGDPLAFAGYEPAEGRTVQVEFQDESGKLSLPNATAATFINLFKAWQIPPSKAERLADALLGWMKKDYVPAVAGSPQAQDYDRGELPFQPPSRPLRSFSELASIDLARDVFYDESGAPNELWHRFVDTFSLYRFSASNLNGAAPDLLTGLGSTDAAQQKRLGEYLSGGGSYTKSEGYFKTMQDATRVLGQMPADNLGTEIKALRVIVTVRQGGGSSYRLNVVVAQPNGAQLPGGGGTPSGQQPPQSQDGNSSNPPAQTPPNAGGGAGAQGAVSSTQGQNGTTAAKKLNYPFALLEIRENDMNSSVPIPGT
jgi:hypothetical protein